VLISPSRLARRYFAPTNHLSRLKDAKIYLWRQAEEGSFAFNLHEEKSQHQRKNFRHIITMAGIDRKADERMEFTTSADVSVAPTFTDSPSLPLLSWSLLNLDQQCISRRTSSVASTHMAMNLLRPFSPERSYKSARVATPSLRRNQVLERQPPSRSACCRSSTQPSGKPKPSFYHLPENLRPRFSQL
jgi:hypothetical protein